ncbi:SO_0444 family Cu/Zn efflux transporter [Desulfococcaceae bacterium HSG7]|nr:SO_0444 family Cu/Zn efflux transporter [Desulfococcaceae bacterium HSG7]
MDLIASIIQASWYLLVESAVYIIFGLIISGLLSTLINPQAISRHLGQRHFKSVFKAALIGIPLPLCSCGVIPAAVTLKKQGASNGATTAFMISTPESGVDSIAITYALLDPIMTVARPMAAFVSATIAGILENWFSQDDKPDTASQKSDQSGEMNGCCNEHDPPYDKNKRPDSLISKISSGLHYAVNEVWADMAAWFFIGLLLAGIITVLIPDDFFSRHLNGGISSMLIMLAFGIPLYICATASTPIAAALIMKGVSPGAALVFLLVGPATNITSLTVLFGILGKRTTAIYLTVIAVAAVFFGLTVDWVYVVWDIEVRAVIGQAAEIIPATIQFSGALLLIILTLIKIVLPALITRLGRFWKSSERKNQAQFGGVNPDVKIPECAKPT